MFINLYTFRATIDPSSGETTVFMQHLVIVILKQVDSLFIYLFIYSSLTWILWGNPRFRYRYSQLLYICIR